MRRLVWIAPLLALGLSACGSKQAINELQRLIPLAQDTAAKLKLASQKLDEISRTAQTQADAEKAKQIFAQTFETNLKTLSHFETSTPESMEMYGQLMDCFKASLDGARPAWTAVSKKDEKAFASAPRTFSEQTGKAGACIEQATQEMSTMSRHPDAILAWRMRRLYTSRAVPSQQSQP